MSSSLANIRATASVKYFVLLPFTFLDSIPLLYRNWDLIPPAMIVSLDMAWSATYNIHFQIQEPIQQLSTTQFIKSGHTFLKFDIKNLIVFLNYQPRGYVMRLLRLIHFIMTYPPIFIFFQYSDHPEKRLKYSDHPLMD